MRRLATIAAALALALTAAPAAAASGLTRVEVQKIEPVGTFGGVAYVRVAGLVHGVVAPGEDVVGLATLPKNGAGEYEYASGFELIAPAPGQPRNEVVYVDSENRGRAVSQGALGDFLPNHRTSYARVQWQTGISPGVPAKAQGVGLVIMRDFGRWLAGRTPPASVSGGYTPAPYGKLILGGISQSAWFVNTFVAEGFNADPADGRRVFDGAIAIDGLGNWLAVNRIAAERAVAGQFPYVDPDGRPLPRETMLKRPQTDPVFIDVANYTDYYRLRASFTASDHSSARFRRYDFPSPHAVGSAQAAARCNGGAPIEYNTLRYAPYMRALVLGLEKAIGVKAASGARPLPHSITFDHSMPPPKSEFFNALPMTQLHVPTVDDDAWPTGGVRFPEADLPLGAPAPPAVPPVVTTSIDATCGNFGGFRRYETTELVRRYGTRADYRRRFAAKVDRLIAQGFLLPEDKAALVEAAGAGLP
jgi:hypothetical protein